MHSHPAMATCYSPFGLTHWVTPRLQSVSGVAAAGLPAWAPEVPERGAQRLIPPSVWGRQGHCPLTGSQKQASASRWAPPGAGAPGIHSCSLGTGRGLTGAEGRESTLPHLGTPSPTPPTHSRRQPPGRRALPWKPARPAVGTASTVAVVQTALAMSCGVAGSLGHGDQYCCCTGRAGRDSFWGHLQARGAQSNRKGSGHSEGLEWIEVRGGYFRHLLYLQGLLSST